MYAFIRGKLASREIDQVVIDVQGVGYELFVPLSSIGKLPPVGQEAILHTSFIVRENSHALYGFLTVQEKNFFEQLIQINGIGPKMALALLGHLSYDRFQEALHRGDIALLTKVPGIGKKTAERLYLELKGKCAPAKPLLPNHAQDAHSALLNLGYKEAEVSEVLKKCMIELPENASTDTLITTALKMITGGLTRKRR